MTALADRFLWGPEPPKWDQMLVGDKQVKRQAPYFNILIFPYAYELTKNPLYAAFCRFYVRSCFPQPQRPFFERVAYGSTIPPLLAVIRSPEREFGRGELERLEKEYVRKIEKLYARKHVKLLEKHVAPRRFSLNTAFDM